MSVALTLNLDLVLVGATASAMCILGFSAFVSNTRSETGRAFFLMTIAGACWSLANYFFYHTVDTTLAFSVIRFVIFIAVWFVLLLFQFLYTFPKIDIVYPWWYRFVVIPATTVVSILTLTPFVFRRVTETNTIGVITGIQNGPGIYVFVVTVVILVFGGLLIFIHKMYRDRGNARMYRPVLWGFFLTFLGIIIGNLLLPAFFGISRFIPLGAVFVLPMIIGAAYAIRVRHLFNIKILATSGFVFILSTASLLELINSVTTIQVLLQSSVFLLVLGIGISLIRSVEKEVEQREHIEKLAKELETTNERQEGLIHFIGHEVKGFLTKASGSFSELVEGDFGELPEDAKRLANEALAETRTGVISVSDILKAANQKRGTISYHFTSFNFKEIVEKQVAQEKSIAERKGLTLSLAVEEGDYAYVGDSAELGDHVLRNLIENAINYTPSGSITVHLSRTENAITVSVTDTGIGITKEDEARLFTEGGHGKESQSVNVYSTGYGLYIAKNTVVAHGGTITEKSDGKGQGTTFTVTLPFEHK